jgi:hypothetical protein
MQGHYTLWEGKSENISNLKVMRLTAPPGLSPCQLISFC